MAATQSVEAPASDALEAQALDGEIALQAEEIGAQEQALKLAQQPSGEASSTPEDPENLADRYHALQLRDAELEHELEQANRALALLRGP